MNIAMYINDILSCRSGENNFSLNKKAFITIYSSNTFDDILVHSLFFLRIEPGPFLLSGKSQLGN